MRRRRSTAIAFSVVMGLGVWMAQTGQADTALPLKMTFGFHWRGEGHWHNKVIGVSGDYLTAVACYDSEAHRNPLNDETSLVSPVSGSVKVNGAGADIEWEFTGENVWYVESRHHYTVRGPITIELYDEDEALVTSRTLDIAGDASGGEGQIQNDVNVIYDAGDAVAYPNGGPAIKKVRAFFSPDNVAGHNSGAFAILYMETGPRVEITQAPEWIVPGCAKNTVEYEVKGMDCDSAKLEVFDQSDALVYSDTGIAATEGTHSVDWNGKDASGNPLTESASPYRIVVTVTKSGDEGWDEETDQRVEEWWLVEILDDPLQDGYATGVDETKVTADLVTTKIRDHHYGGACSWTALSFTAVAVDYSVEMLLNSAGAEHVFYVMPPDKKYELESSVLAGGAEDRVGNEFDADDSAAGAQKNFAFEFRIESGGTINVLSQETW